MMLSVLSCLLIVIASTRAESHQFKSLESWDDQYLFDESFFNLADGSSWSLNAETGANFENKASGLDSMITKFDKTAANEEVPSTDMYIDSMKAADGVYQISSGKFIE
jgi:hypothetical protein